MMEQIMARKNRLNVEPTPVVENALVYFAPETAKPDDLREYTALELMFGYFNRD